MTENFKIKKIALFASGSGSNVQNIAEYFKNSDKIKVDCILSNKKDAHVLQRAKNLKIDSCVFNRDEFYNTEKILDFLVEREIDFVVLAGFLWLVPGYLIEHYKNKLINIHPALLPKYGGRGMYGMKVHEAVAASGDNETGITIHYVNEKYDEGDIIFQSKCAISKEDSPNSIANKVHTLEYEHFPKVIEKLVMEI